MMLVAAAAMVVRMRHCCQVFDNRRAAAETLTL